MTVNADEVRRLLKTFEFKKLFVDRLGWDRHQARPLVVPADGAEYTLDAVAHKRGMTTYLCSPGPDGAIPDAAIRRRIDKEVTKASYEHIIVFADAARTTQVWQWVRRQHGKPAAFRQHTFHIDQPGDSLIQKLLAIRFTLDQEERLTQPEVPGRVRQAFDLDRVTKRFYDVFKREHAAFLAFIEGITLQGDREWYASVMLNRLMFVYFIQKQGFLNGDHDYLRNRLQRVRKERGAGQFHSFYHYFLLRLFQEGLGQSPAARKPELDALLGKVPYLNGGIFELHELERDHREIEIPDEAFERIFTFFDAYQWRLDDRPLAADNQINPDVLGYIFEKYINQKQMGAYYTKEDITGYIARNTILPFLLDAAAKARPDAFRPDGPVWRLLRDDPDKYIYEAVRHGVDLPLPEAIAPGVTDVSRRDGWNRAAADGFKLPTETWREHVERRTRCHELRRKMRAGEVHAVNDLITYNLDVCQFAEDVIDSCDDPELLRAVWGAVEKVSVLDPTCGSGAFLFAALNILESLYEACLDRMQEFLDELDALGAPRRPEKFADFRKVLDQVKRHPSRRYFIYKSIIIHNLYGVDIMKEAVEICKLRLFLKLVSQAQRVDQLEPLPDIDFNIRAGNTLVGFVSLAQVREIAKGRLVLDPQTVEQVLVDARRADEEFQRFQEMQNEFGAGALDFQDVKAGLRGRLAKLRDQLDRHLANEYDVDPDKPAAFAAWRESHKPFHWFTEFYGIVAAGGFGVIIGNPPYVEYSKVRREYRIIHLECEPCGNLYAFSIERSYQLLAPEGRFGFIVQAPIVSTQRMSLVRAKLKRESCFLSYATFDDRPSKLFDGMHHCRLAIILSSKRGGAGAQAVGTTKYNKWYDVERPYVFSCLSYLHLPEGGAAAEIIPKFRSQHEASAFRKITKTAHRLGELISRISTSHRLYYKITGVGHWFAFTTRPPRFWREGQEGNSTREQSVAFTTSEARDTAFCCLWSTLHYWLYQARTNCRDFNPSDLEYLPMPGSLVQGIGEFSALAPKIMKCLEENAQIGNATYAVGGAVKYEKFRPKLAKPFFDQVDAVLARHYGLTGEELDFILNYDIKYRMGQDAAGEEDE
jgi:hypothetical protein